MNEKKTPSHRLVWSHKQTKEKVRVGTGWPSQYGVSLTLDKGFTSKNGEQYPGVIKLEATLSDGTVVDASEYYMNLDVVKPRQY